MKAPELLETIKIFKQIRELAHDHLPIDHSFIPYDILLQVCASHSASEKISVKGLFAKLPFSDMGIRYHFDRLVKEGWIELSPDQTDGRVKLAIPSEKLLEKFQAVVEGYNDYQAAHAQPAQNTESFKITRQVTDRVFES